MLHSLLCLFVSLRKDGKKEEEEERRQAARCNNEAHMCVPSPLLPSHPIY